MLNPKEKSAELTEKFITKEFARMCVREIMRECVFLGTADYRIPYWKEVLTHLQ